VRWQKSDSFGFAEGSALCVGAKPNVPLVQLAKIVFKKEREHMVNTVKVTTDGLPAYKELGRVVKEHKANITPPKEAHKLFPYVHTAISNAKGILRNVYRCVDEDFLENYLNEYSFNLNRRYFGCIMERVLVAGVNQKWNYLG